MEKKINNKGWRYHFKKLVHNPWLDFTVGIILALSGLVEVLDTFPRELSEFRMGVHHGVFLLGIATILKAVASMFAGLEFIDEGQYLEKENSKKSSEF